jgi:hypothetical protein
MIEVVGPLPPSSISLVTPTKARDIAHSLKSLADEYAKIGMPTTKPVP